MKLAGHYNKASIIVSVSVLITGAIIYFFVINYIARRQFDSDLSEEVSEVLAYINYRHHLPTRTDFDEDEATFVKTGLKKMDTYFFDTVYYNTKQKRIEDRRAVKGLLRYNNQNYLFTISVSKESTEYLIQIITLITLALMTLLLIILFITNRYILNDLWKPFYYTLNKIKLFNISDDSELQFQTNKVDEFREMNSAVAEMSIRAKTDFHNLKSFTENASHEMLTPLAVITAKLDTLIQDERLNAEQLTHINDIYASINKSTRLNQSLLLLVKIDNSLIKDDEVFNLQEAVNEKIQQFQELMQSKNISVTTHLQDRVITASKYLTDILLNNLFSNAVRHNNINGQLHIILSSSQFIIKNTGDITPLDNNSVFDRFLKGKNSQGTGLGLTLVKSICLYYKFNITYSFKNSMHAFIIDLPVATTNN
ncbi:sensor histidine kinase [Mucilaginibacter segetis]|uniref:histidine kinase n=1 Tax=Mucilaginibacter segetis TaxID=2793071 RepID=A0A934PQJ5_9SPHI|nr:HAMP domain-containing sensor histidine kinase [Mucilaginibacter segetis]MBK0378918.1 HAMP domain-containing histidine kinase [Mucilaginibacter segetis]